MSSFQDLTRAGIADLRIYEPGRPIEEVARALGFASADEIVKLASNENALGPSPKAMAAVRAAVGELHRYPDGDTYTLRKALAAKLDLSPDNILPGNGSNELIELLAHVFLSQVTSLVMAECAFVVYRLVASCFGAAVIGVPMQALTHDLPAMLRAVRSDTRLVFIANPNNPTGTRVSSDAIERFMDAVPEHVVVCFDEAYVDLLDPERQPDTLRYVREGRKAVVLRTFSKSHGLAGLRMGYALAPADCIQLLNRVRQPFNVNAMGQIAAVAALADDAHVEATRRMVSEGIAYMEDACRELALDFVPTCVNFMLVKVGDGRAVFEALMHQGVIVRPMDGYGLPEYVRVTVGRPAENERLRDALRCVLG